MSNTEQFRLTADYLKEQRLSPSFPSRFFSKVTITECCWFWNGGVSTGYGSISRGFWKGGTIMAHVASWIIHFGPVPDGAYVCHDCPEKDNRLCVNPAHLYIGDGITNSRDKKIKGSQPYGEECYNSKLTWERVDEARYLCWLMGWTTTAVALRNGVSRRTIAGVISNTKWVRGVHG